MPPEPRPSALRRMAGAAPEPRAAPPSRDEAPHLERALATAALRVADGLPGLGLATGARAVRMAAHDDAFDGIDERALCLLVDPPGHDPLAAGRGSTEALAARLGVLAFDPGLSDALVEAQTIGRVDGPARPPRRPTRIDAALAQPFAAALLEQAVRQLPTPCEEPRPGALRAGSFVAGPVSLPLILTAPRFVRLDLALQLGFGARTGTLTLILPAGEAPAAAGPAEAQQGPAAEWDRLMREAAMASPVRLEAVLPPMRLPLSRLMALRVGDLVPLEPGALAEVTLHGGSSGVTIGGRRRLPRGAALKARLGQLNGLRAVKIAALPGERIADAPGDGRDDDPAFGQAQALVPAASPSPQPAAGAAEATKPAPAAPAMPDLPDLPPVPDLPDLPPVPELPDLP